MEWLEQLKANAPYVLILGTGIGVVWKAFLDKDKALQDSQAARISDLKEIVAKSSKD